MGGDKFALLLDGVDQVGESPLLADVGVEPAPHPHPGVPQPRCERLDQRTQVRAAAALVLQRLVFTGRHIDAREAMDCHLIERLTPPDGRSR